MGFLMIGGVTVGVTLTDSPTRRMPVSIGTEGQVPIDRVGRDAGAQNRRRGRIAFVYDLNLEGVGLPGFSGLVSLSILTMPS